MFHTPTIEDKTKEALLFLQTNCKSKGPIQLCNSGGKDSIVTVDIFKKSKLPYVMQYSNTGIDPPEVLEFIKDNYPECVICKPIKPFLLDIANKNPPLRSARWCCEKLKKQPGDKLKIKHRVEGIRKEESNTRSKYSRINYNKKRNSTAYYPILDWTEKDVWDYIEKHNLPYPSVYDEGLSRLGCIVCIYHSNKGGKGHTFYRKWWWKRKATGRDMAHDCPESFIKDWYEGTVSWYKKPEKQKQKGIFY